MKFEIITNLVTHDDYSINNYESLKLSYDGDSYSGEYTIEGDDINTFKILIKGYIERIFTSINANINTTEELLDLFKSIMFKIDNIDIEHNLDHECIQTILNGNYEGSYIKIYFSDFKMKDFNNVWLVIHNHEYGYEILKIFDTDQAAKNYKRFYGIRHKNLNSINIIKVPVESDSKLYKVYDKETD